MPASLSIEARILAALRDLGCSAQSFVGIAKEKGIPISIGGFSEAKNGVKSFALDTGRRLLELTELMRSAQTRFPDCPLDWSQTQKTAMLLSLVLLKEVAQAEGYSAIADDAESALNLEAKQ